MLKKGKRQGFLVVVLIMSLLFFIIAVAVCSYLGVQYSMMGESEQSLRALYAADSGVQYALGLIALSGGANSSTGRYFGYLNGSSFRSYSSSIVTLYEPLSGVPQDYPNPDNTVNVIPFRPMPQEVSGWSAMEYLYSTRNVFNEDFAYWKNLEVYGDFAWKLLWDDGVGTAVYFTVVRATQFPNGVPIITPPPNTAQVGFTANTAPSYNEQISKAKLATSRYNPGSPCMAQYIYGPLGGSNCDETNPPRATNSHIHCRYTIKSIGEVWAYHLEGASRKMDRALARRTVMAEIGTIMPVDRQFFDTAGHKEVPINIAGKILRWYEVFR